LAGTGKPPVSLQLIGPLDSEPLLLETGRQLEQEDLVKFVSPALPESPWPAGN
jgi:Asp-tRNA(Asn)/Glu-tRNA(Gln) amidotransferase A subunit family amidase